MYSNLILLFFRKDLIFPLPDISKGKTVASLSLIAIPNSLTDLVKDSKT